MRMPLPCELVRRLSRLAVSFIAADPVHCDDWLLGYGATLQTTPQPLMAYVLRSLKLERQSAPRILDLLP